MPRILIGNIKGPKGDTGARGATGPEGPVGPQGPLPPLTNNFLATVAGQAALDAVAGKTLKEQLDQQNSNFVTPHEASGFRMNKFGQVDFQLAITKDYSGDLTTIAQAPQQCVPVSRKMVVGSALIDGSRIPATFYVETSGAVRVYTATTAKTGVLFAVGGSYSIK